MDEQKLRKLTDELKDMMLEFNADIARLTEESLNANLEVQDKVIRQYETKIFDKLKEYNDG